MNSTSLDIDFTLNFKEKQFNHFNIETRKELVRLCSIYLKKNLKPNISKIAKLLGKSRASIYREFKRNANLHRNAISNNTKKLKYNYIIANKLAVQRRKNSKFYTKKLIKNIHLLKYIDEMLLKKYSPDVIAYRINHNNKFNETISANCIYDAIRSGITKIKIKDMRRMKIYKVKRFKEKHFKELKESKISRSIEKRPESINNRQEFGHFELDTVIGKKSGKRECLMTLTERKTRFEIIIRLNNKSSEEVLNKFKMIAEYLGNKKNIIFRSITTDNGSEFSKFKEIEEILKTNVYFCHPYSSYEKGTNERHNGMIRDYIPKSSNIEQYDNEYLQNVADRMNDYERKKMGYLTPYQAVLKYANDIEAVDLLFELQSNINKI